MSVLKYKDLETGKWVATGGGAGGSGGADGFSPVANVTQTDTGATITITDKKGTTTATVSNGKDGKDGKTAYQHAQDGGYAGTEEAFAEKLAAQPDWNTAEGKPGHVLNRTHWVDIEEKTFYDGSVSVSGNTAFLTADTYPFATGETYSVEWEGTTFECTCVECLIQGLPAVGFGNPYIYGGDYGAEPFFVASMFGLGTLVMAFTDGTYHIKVTGPQYTFHPLSRELLPEGSTYYIDVTYEYIPGTGEVYTTDITQVELQRALANGYTIIARYVQPTTHHWRHFVMDSHENDRNVYFHYIDQITKSVDCLKFVPNDATGGYDINFGQIHISGNTSTASGSKVDTKLFLIGATRQDANGVGTYSNTNCYIGTDNRLYSGGAVVPNTAEIEALIDAKLGVIENGSY